MLLFCPTCANILTVTPTPLALQSHSSSTLDNGIESPQNRFTCRTCPYVYPITKRFYDKKTLPRKEVADILGGGDEFQNCSTTETSCPNEKCDGSEAKFYQLQIRSADEPMTSFLKVSAISAVAVVVRRTNECVRIVSEVWKAVD
jgi:DNA-directed RNA polymerase III subunit RPC11